MPDWHRRSVLTTGVTLSTSWFASIGAGTSDPDRNRAAELPDPRADPNPEQDEDWASYKADAGHSRFVEDGYEFDGDTLEAAWRVEHDGAVAVADDTVYTTTACGAIALDAADGSLRWENTAVDARNPAVAGESVYLVGDELVALDREDGSVRWESALEPSEWISSHTAAYDGVFVVVDGTLYALEAVDGSVRWQRDSVRIEKGDEEFEYEFVTGAAAANGVVYARTQGGLVAFEPASGDEVWQRGKWYSGATESDIHATMSAVLVEDTTIEYGLHDAQTGDDLGLVSSETWHEPALGERCYITGTNYEYYSRSIYGDDYDWDLSVTYTYGQAVISGETVYAYFAVDGHNYGDREYDRTLVALDKRDGSEKWTLSKDDAPVGHVRAISDETLYVDHDGELVALREFPSSGC